MGAALAHRGMIQAPEVRRLCKTTPFAPTGLLPDRRRDRILRLTHTWCHVIRLYRRAFFTPPKKKSGVCAKRFSSLRILDFRL